MTTKHPRVSVIIPAYNSAKFIAEAIRSVQVQTYKDFEIIVADDGSTDATEEILTSFGDAITVLKLPHRGICASRNEAIRRSSGEFIALIDSDDIWESNKLQLQVAYLDKHPEFALVYSYHVNFTEKSEGGLALPKKLDFEGYIFKDLFTKNGFANSTIVMRRSVFDAVGGYDESLDAMEDYDLNLRIARKYQMGRVPEVLLRRRVHPGSYYTSGYDNQYIYQLPVYDKYMSDPEVAHEIGVTKQEYMSGFILKFIFRDLYEGHKDFILRKLRDLERYSPDKAEIARKLVESNDLSSEVWGPLVPEFDIWAAEVEHKAALFKERNKKGNFNIGAGRLNRHA